MLSGSAPEAAEGAVSEAEAAVIVSGWTALMIRVPAS